MSRLCLWEGNVGSGQAHRAADAAAPHLKPGEQVTATGFGTMGQVSVGKNIALAIVAGIVSAGTVIASRRPRKAYYALTSQRLLAFDGEGLFGRPGKLLFSLPLQAAKVVRSSKNFLGFVRVDLAIEGQPKGLRVSFASGSQQAGEAVIAAIKSAGGVHASEAIEAGPAAPGGYAATAAPAAAPAGYGSTQAGGYGAPQPDYSSSLAGYGSSSSSGYGSPQPGFSAPQAASSSPQPRFADPLQSWDSNPRPAQDAPVQQSADNSPQQGWDQQPRQSYGTASQSPWERQPQQGWGQQSQPQSPWESALQQERGDSSQPRTVREDKRPTQEWQAPEDW